MQKQDLFTTVYGSLLISFSVSSILLQTIVSLKSNHPDEKVLSPD